MIIDENIGNIRITNITNFLNIFVYLKKCCEKVRDTLFYIEHSSSTFYNGYLPQQLFVWNTTSTEDINYNSEIFFETLLKFEMDK